MNMSVARMLSSFTASPVFSMPNVPLLAALTSLGIASSPEDPSAGSDPVTGKRRMVKRSRFATKAEAEAARDEVVRKLQRGVLRFEVPTLAEHVATWLPRAERTEELKATTLRECRRYADYYVMP